MVFFCFLRKRGTHFSYATKSKINPRGRSFASKLETFVLNDQLGISGFYASQTAI
jgi:hypothetical protein